MIHFFYSQTTAEGGGFIEFTDHVNLTIRPMSLTTLAEQASVGTSEIIVEDTAADFLSTGHRKVWVTEDQAPVHQQLLFWGYTGERKLMRVDGPVTTRRKWVVQLTDINTILARKVMAGNDTKRPVETDVQRIKWLLTTGETANLNDKTTYVSSLSPVDMSDSDYNGQMLSSIIDDCEQQSGKNAYMRWIWSTTAGNYVDAFWYGPDNSSLATSTLRISNVLADVDSSTTWAASYDSVLSYDPSRVYSGVFGNYDGGFTYRTRAATITDFANRDTITSWPNVRSLAAAQARGDRYLDTLHTEEQVITTTITVPSANVNDAMAGDLVSVKFSEFPPFTSFTSCRILRKTVTWASQLNYEIEYELTPIAAIQTGTLLVAFINMGGPGSLTEPTDLSTNTWTKAFWTGNYANAGQFPGPGGPGSYGMWYRAVVPGESSNVITVQNQAAQALSVWVYEVSGVASTTPTATTSGIDTVPYSLGGPANLSSASAASNSVFIGGFMLQKVSYGQATTMNSTQGTELANTNGFNTVLACGATDRSPPKVWLGYQTGTGVMTIGGTLQCDGAGPGDYNFYGRGKGGLTFTLADTFSLVQQGFGYAVGANVGVVLPSAP